MPCLHLKVPLVDAPVVTLHSGAVLSKDVDHALKDSVDRKNKMAIEKKSNEASSFAIRASAILSNFTRATDKSPSGSRSIYI